MPHLRFRGVEKEKVKEISRVLVDQLAEIVGCPRDWFTLECIDTEFIFDGEESRGYPFVEVLWFDRGQEAKNRAATAVTHAIKSKYPTEDTCVIFTNLNEKDYYENGNHF